MRCLTPNFFEGSYRRCRKCDGCREFRKFLYIGRALAETESSLDCLMITCTYRGNGPETQVFVTKHASNFIKAMRSRYGAITFMRAGEFGDKKGRVHWHFLIWFKERKLLKSGEPALVVLSEREHFEKYPDADNLGPPISDFNLGGMRCHPCWPHGHIQVERPGFKGISYVAKYMMKGSKLRHPAAGPDDMAPVAPGYSRIPFLGKDYVDSLIDHHLETQVMPNDTYMTFDGVVARNGKRYRFPMFGKMRSYYLRQLHDRYFVRYGNPPPHNDFLSESWDYEVAAGWEPLPHTKQDGGGFDDFVQFVKSQAARNPSYMFGQLPDIERGEVVGDGLMVYRSSRFGYFAQYDWKGDLWLESLSEENARCLLLCQELQDRNGYLLPVSSRRPDAIINPPSHLRRRLRSWPLDPERLADLRRHWSIL